MRNLVVLGAAALTLALGVAQASAVGHASAGVYQTIRASGSTLQKSRAVTSMVCDEFMTN